MRLLTQHHSILLYRLVFCMLILVMPLTVLASAPLNCPCGCGLKVNCGNAGACREPHSCDCGSSLCNYIYPEAQNNCPTDIKDCNDTSCQGQTKICNTDGCLADFACSCSSYCAKSDTLYPCYWEGSDAYMYGVANCSNLLDNVGCDADRNCTCEQTFCKAQNTYPCKKPPVACTTIPGCGTAKTTCLCGTVCYAESSTSPCPAPVSCKCGAARCAAHSTCGTVCGGFPTFAPCAPPQACKNSPGAAGCAGGATCSCPNVCQKAQSSPCCGTNLVGCTCGHSSCTCTAVNKCKNGTNPPNSCNSQQKPCSCNYRDCPRFGACASMCTNNNPQYNCKPTACTCGYSSCPTGKCKQCTSKSNPVACAKKCNNSYCGPEYQCNCQKCNQAEKECVHTGMPNCMCSGYLYSNFGPCWDEDRITFACERCENNFGPCSAQSPWMCSKFDYP